MTARYSLRRIGGDVIRAIRRGAKRLVGGARDRKPEPGDPVTDLAGADDDAYTLFEGTALRLYNLAVPPLEHLRVDPGLLPGAFRIRVARSSDSPSEM